MKTKKICIITGCRAEWGLFYPLARKIADEATFKLSVIATGAHLSDKYGFTYREIEQDGFEIAGKAEIPLPDDTGESLALSIGEAIKGLTPAVKNVDPDLVLLLGDRLETFAAALSCLLLKKPIVHIHGGELTEGSLDDAFRHSITKMAHLHFVSTETYRARVIRMGEDPSRVFNVGAIGIDNIRGAGLLTKDEFQEKAGFSLGKRNLMITFNPPTSEEASVSIRQLDSLLEAVDGLEEVRLIFTRPNPDIYSGMVAGKVDDYVSRNTAKSSVFTSMGRVLYLSALQFMDAVVGNSSSGIIEVPSFGIPTVNIGDRQKGRVRAASVIDCAADKTSILKAIHKGLSHDFRASCRRVKNPYGEGNVAEKIVSVLKGTDINGELLRKKFYDAA